ncbi:uncharacterized protein LOC100175297, partial [Ciona intestinalis]
SCYVTADDVISTVQSIQCPSGCDVTDDKLWGTGVYSGNSCICAGAIHDGRITAESGGLVTIRKVKGQAYYDGTTQFNVTSRNHTRYNSSFQFQSSYAGRQPLYAVSCLATAEFTHENEYLVMCPPGCDVISGGLWGTDRYKMTSYLCGAAIHAGVLNATIGGRFAVMKKSGQRSFNGSTSNGVTSRSCGTENVGFVIRACPQALSAVIAVTCDFRADDVIEDVFTVSCPSGCGVLGAVIGSGPYSVTSNVCGAAVHDGILKEFLGGDVTVRKVTWSNSYQSSRRNGVTSEIGTTYTKSFVLEDSTTQYPEVLEGKTHARRFGIQFAKNSKKSFLRLLFSPVSCSTKASDILDDTFSVACPGNCRIFQPLDGVVGTRVYAESSSICKAALHFGSITANNGGVVIVRKMGKLQRFEGSVKNGIQSHSSNLEAEKAFVFGGNLEELDLPLKVSCNFAAHNSLQAEFNVKCATDCPQVVTDNGRFPAYTSVCGAANNLGSEFVTVIKTTGMLDNTAAFKDRRVERSNPVNAEMFAYKGEFVVVEQQHPSLRVVAVSCTTRADQISSHVFMAVCPQGCLGLQHKIWGTDVFTDDSYICSAALHQMRITDFGGLVTIRKQPGVRSYLGSTEESVTSMSRDQPWDTSFVFQNTYRHSSSVFTVRCDTVFSAFSDERFAVLCPPDCLSVEDEDYICVSAIRNGTITDAGGVVTVRSIANANRTMIESYRFV